MVVDPVDLKVCQPVEEEALLCPKEASHVRETCVSRPERLARLAGRCDYRCLARQVRLR